MPSSQQALFGPPELDELLLLLCRLVLHALTGIEFTPVDLISTPTCLAAPVEYLLWDDKGSILSYSNCISSHITDPATP